MAASTSFEKFLDGYIKNLAVKNEPESFDSYSGAAMREIERIKQESQTKALEDYALSTRPYGRRDEILASYGLYGSGYNKYRNILKELNLNDSIAAAEDTANDAVTDAYQSYADYLASETKRQDSLMSSVTRTLASSKILDPVEIYKYAIEAGMTKERAESTITKVYNSVKNVVKRDILERLASNEYDLDLALAYAKSVGLKGDDLDDIEAMAKIILKNFSVPSGKDYYDDLEELENLGNHTNETH